ncbi:hypothetical protein FOXG_17646 [Fusarium oxysporum f. sp. lycopersici 4287]|uniref:Uncharacterized protein n=1 Tax=Fusarium oxysporum f. sp. lycopersici (strain 4287 / CBS 123668 / FGSC 9935 / NRRL 34936) TaxID=426428 RepID=A0A0J9WCU7_FUSO4|nr:uncharacterized protein FOXG_17646 [Fusarium oxysporum f. sp. lycopersici 4287]KNB20698.1 hypothetical protein FOXG_17646 [Fusarium oxysporum f. sp. lycopersici 4287]
MEGSRTGLFHQTLSIYSWCRCCRLYRRSWRRCNPSPEGSTCHWILHRAWVEQSCIWSFSALSYFICFVSMPDPG